jgi:hypothetical protein
MLKKTVDERILCMQENLEFFIVELILIKTNPVEQFILHNGRIIIKSSESNNQEQ